MGAWGTGIFEDDTALDVRASYLDQIISGASDEQATAQVMAEFEEEADEDYAIIVWMALAATQWEVGRLQESVKSRTLELLEKGDSPLWEEEGEDPERAAVLAELKTKLNSPQPPRLEGQALKDHIGQDAVETVDGGCCCGQHANAVAPASGKKWWEFWK